mmetsp:Transcript_15080/g.35318  ORF Transcript_15080/g.35318 Transcript_15080/m.35318 type:complete len:89 (+) Transcript_15080:299-565(+)
MESSLEIPDSLPAEAHAGRLSREPASEMMERAVDLPSSLARVEAVGEDGTDQLPSFLLGLLICSEGNVFNDCGIKVGRGDASRPAPSK